MKTRVCDIVTSGPDPLAFRHELYMTLAIECRVNALLGT